MQGRHVADAVPGETESNIIETKGAVARENECVGKSVS